MPKSTTKKTSKAHAASSPGRRIKTKTPVRRKKGGNPQLKVIAFSEEFTFEAYFYEKNNGDEGYVYNLKEYMRGNLAHSSEDADILNLVDMVNQRLPNTNNVRATTSSSDTYPRTLFIRYPPGNESTAATRQEGLHALKNFFQDPRFTAYPPANIDLTDLTDEENPPALDEYFMNEDIKTLMEEDVEPQHLNNDFATTFPEFARKCWKFNHISDWGLHFLGFAALLESENNGS